MKLTGIDRLDPNDVEEAAGCKMIDPPYGHHNGTDAEQEAGLKAGIIPCSSSYVLTGFCRLCLSRAEEIPWRSPRRI